MTDCSSVDRVQQAFEEAKVEAQTYFGPKSQLLSDMAAVLRAPETQFPVLKTQVVTLQEKQDTSFFAYRSQCHP